ncbi:MAG: L,D-transpeptidase family protein [Candidatus Binatia bacterium]
MRRGIAAIAVGLLAACGLVGFASAFALASSAGADTGTTTTTTEPPPPTTEPPPPTEPDPEPDPPKPPLIAPGVIVGNLAVGWMTPRRAAELVKKTFSRPLPLVVSDTRTLRVAPQKVGARAKIEKAIRRARSARPGAEIPLDVDVSRTKLRRYLEDVAKRFDREAVDAGVVLRGVKPRLIVAADGRRLKVLRNSLAIRIALSTHSRDRIWLDFEVFEPKVKEATLGTSIVILRESKRLLFFVKEKLQRRFGIATGQASYPTPIGEFEIVTLQRNPWWYPPPSDWAADADPVPPGPGNPLGTRWMGLSAQYVGIHGTPDAASIGYSASHGCIRMRIPDAEWLFQRVKVGTPVFILSR